MSIYATAWELKVPRHHFFDEEWARVYAQSVPPHIGHPSEYPDGDPYSDFLPPPVSDYDPETGTASFDRAVLIIQEGRDRKVGQRYIDPLLVLSGEDYSRITFGDLLNHKAIGWDESVVGMFLKPDGEKEILRSDKELDDQ
jgi:hypothetical protein